MFNFILAIQIIVAIAMVGLILLQHGKGADAGASFGSGASGTVFGAAGSANFLTRATAVLTAIFFVTSLLLAIEARKIETDQRSLDVSAIETSTPVNEPLATEIAETETADELLTEADINTEEVSAEAVVETEETPAQDIPTEKLEKELATVNQETEEVKGEVEQEKSE